MRRLKPGFLRARICAFVWTAVALSSAQGQQVALIESLIRSQQYDRASQLAQSALKKNPNDFRLWTLEGIALSLEQNNPGALRAFQRALSLSPNYPPALKGAVQLLYPAGDRRAVPLLERILKANPQDETANEMLANLDGRAGDCQAAVRHFVLCGKTIETHPESLQAYGYCLVQTEQARQAIQVFRQLTELLPMSGDAKYDLAAALVEARQNEAALHVLEFLLAAGHPDPQALRLASQAYEAMNDTLKAVSLLRQAIVFDPKNANDYIAFAAFCLDHDSFRVGIDMIDAGLEHVPDNPSLYIARGLLYAKLARYDKAEADFDTAERLDSTQSLSSYAVDLTALERHRPDKALAEIRLQLKAHPDSAMLHYLFATLHVDQGSDTRSEAFNEAMISALLAVKLKPDFAKARDLLASMYMRRGQYGLAIEQSRLALQYSPSDRSAIYHLIIAFRHSGQRANNNEIQVLLKRLSALQQASMREETERKGFRLVEGAKSQSPPSSAAPDPSGNPQ